MAAIGFLLHPERPEAAALAADLGRWLLDRGHEVRMTVPDATRAGLDEVAMDADDLVVGLDLLVGIGGDGTMLQAADRAAEDDVPVLGVNMGQLGYLTTIEPEGARVALKRFLAGSYDVDERMRIAGEIHRRDGSVEVAGTALNEALLERSELGHTIRIAVVLDGEPFTTYVADAMIVSTPTGSTAYALSARGPIVDPRHRAQVLVPVAPHMLFDRALVLEASAEIRLVVTGSRSAHLSMDGRSVGTVEEGDAVLCRAAPVPARLVRFGPSRFQQVLKEKFGLSDR